MIDPVRALIDKARITERLMRYPRGIDRGATRLLKSVYHPDGTDDHGIFKGNAWAFADFMAGFDETLGVRQQSHCIDNVWIELTGPDSAVSEAYHVAYVRAETDDGFFFSMIGGRYLDRWARRGGEWRILTRRYVMDWNMNGPSLAKFDEGPFKGMRRGSVGPDDPGCRLPEIEGLSDEAPGSAF